MRIFKYLTAFAIVGTTASAEMDTQTRRDFIAACMFSGGISVSGREPTVTDADGSVDIDRTVQSWVDAFDKPADKLAAGREIRSCIQQILDANSYEKRQSRIVPRDNLYAELALSVDPIRYAEGVVCKRPDIRQHLMIGHQLRQFGQNIDPNTKSAIDEMVGGILGVNMKGSFESALFQVNPATLDCSQERICDVRGSVPVDVLSNTMYVFDIPMRQVEVLAGQCEGKTGFVNERFIDF